MKHVLKDVVPVWSFIFAIYYGYEDVRQKSKSKEKYKNAKLPSSEVIFTIGEYILCYRMYFPKHMLIRKKLNSFFLLHSQQESESVSLQWLCTY